MLRFSGLVSVVAVAVLHIALFRFWFWCFSFLRLRFLLLRFSFSVFPSFSFDRCPNIFVVVFFDFVFVVVAKRFS